MGEELDRMMWLRRWSYTFLVLFIVAIAVIIGLLIFMNTGDYYGTNKDFNNIVAQGEVESKTIELDEFSKLYFFSQVNQNQRTLFTNAIPNLKIVDSLEYKVEITSNADILDKLDIFALEEGICVSFKDEHYNSILNGRKSYRGLYVDASKFDITVYAPIAYLVSDAEFNLDFEAPNVQTLVVAVNGEISKGRIYDVNSDAVGIFLSGKSDLAISGESREYTELLVKHNSKLDVSELKMRVISETTASQLFALSSIKYANRVKYSFDNIGFIITVAMILGSVLLFVGFVVFRILFLKQKKEIDQYIEQVETEGKFLQIP